MNRTRFWLLGSFVLVSALLVGAIHKTRQQPMWILTHYPRNGAFNRHLSDIMGEIKTPDVGSDAALLQFSIPGNADFSETRNVRVLRDGACDYFQSFPARPSEDFGIGAVDLNPPEIDKVRRLIAQLPPSAAPKRREDLLVVLIYEPSPPHLRLYDRHHPPHQIKEIMKLTGGIVGVGDQSISNSHNAVN